MEVSELLEDMLLFLQMKLHQTWKLNYTPEQ